MLKPVALFDYQQILNWVKRIRAIDVEMIVPQHGQAFKGREMINQFLNWFERLECGVDLMYSDKHSGERAMA